MTGGFWYLATPYSQFPRGHAAAHREACRAAALCFHAGIPVFSPIAHGYVIAKIGKMATRASDWERINSLMVEASAGVIVAMLDGWESSTGVNQEVTLAKTLNKPVHFMPARGPAPDLATPLLGGL